jgi:hypothetical protein
MQSHFEVISAFGGYSRLARLLGVSPRVARHWPKRGIPARYWPKVEEIAVTRDIVITAKELSRLPVVVQ